MSSNKELKQYQEQINQCVRCGACQAHCPVYMQERKEGAVARGKLAIAKALLEGEVEIGKHLEEDISLCLMCGSCTVKCPNKVPTGRIVGAIRRRIGKDKGISITGKTISTVTGSRPLMKTLVKTADALSSLFLKKIPETSGLRLRFPFTPLSKRALPAIAGKNLFQMYDEIIPGEKGKPVIGIFAGCSITYLYPHIGAAMIEVLRHMGYTVYLPHTQSCCGIPAGSSGHGETIERLSEVNRAAFSSHEVEHIVTACATCRTGIGDLAETMDGDFSAFSSKVTDILSFLHQQGIGKLLKALPPEATKTKVSYHDPCHLRTKGVTNEPRELLKSIPGIEYREMEDASTCCGLGGTFSIYHYECSRAIGQRKLRGITDADADILATACPGCMMQLQDIIAGTGLQIRIAHVIELIHQAVDRNNSPST